MPRPRQTMRIPLFTQDERRRHWQLEMSSRSLKKRAKLRTLLDFIGPTPGLRCVEIGCDRGVTSYFLRKLGGTWLSTDPDDVNTAATKALVGASVARIDYERIGVGTASVDRVVAIDCLEHIERDDRLMSEIVRVMKADGVAVISAPQTGPFFVLHRVASALGLKPAFYGHVREGYTERRLRELIEAAGLRVVGRAACSRFLTEGIELLVNVAYMFVLHRKGEGGIAPANEAALRRHGLSFRLFSAVYPVLWLLSQLDRLLFFSKGYILLLKAVKTESAASTRDPS